MPRAQFVGRFFRQRRGREEHMRLCGVNNQSKLLGHHLAWSLRSPGRHLLGISHDHEESCAAHLVRRLTLAAKAQKRLSGSEPVSQNCLCHRHHYLRRVQARSPCGHDPSRRSSTRSCLVKRTMTSLLMTHNWPRHTSWNAQRSFLWSSARMLPIFQRPWSETRERVAISDYALWFRGFANSSHKIRLRMPSCDGSLHSICSATASPRSIAQPWRSRWQRSWL